MYQKNRPFASMSSTALRSPSITLNHFALAGTGLARIVASIIHTDESRNDLQVVASSLREKFENKLVAVAGSIKTVQKGQVSDTITALVSVSKDVIALDKDETPQGFKAVACNMFIDDEDHLWSLNRSADGNLLIRSNGIDDDASLLSLLSAQASASSTSTVAREMLACASAVQDSVEAGSLVTYVNAGNALTLGFVVASDAEDPERLMVLEHGQKDADIISINAVTETHDVPEAAYMELSTDEEIEIAVAAAGDGFTAEHLINYYRRVFGNHPHFFDELSARIRSHNFG